MQTKEIKELVKLMKNDGVLVLQTQGIEIHLHPNAAIPRRRTVKAKATSGEIPFIGGYTEEDALNWSASNP